MNNEGITRRDVLKGVAGLQLGFVFAGLGGGSTRVVAERLTDDGVGTGNTGPAGAGPLAEATAVTAWLTIDSEGITTLAIPKSDMGQGVYTGLARILADELDADWANVRVLHAPLDFPVTNQMTAGSSSTRQLWTPMRQAGAVARSMLIAAAATRWGVAAAECSAAAGVVSHAGSGRSLGYGELASDAANQPVPDANSVPLKTPDAFTLVGQAVGRVNAREIVTAEAQYGIDVRVPDMVYAVAARCPTFDGSATGYDESAALAVPGVLAVVKVRDDCIAVVATNTWAAMKGRDALNVAWDLGPNAGLSSPEIRGLMRAARGELPVRPASELRYIEAEFDLPYLAHAALEPLNCVADVRADGVTVWAPTQSPGGLQGSVARALGVANGSVDVKTTLLGGAFGRRIDSLYAVEAATVSKAVAKPVKLLWTRVDDTQHDTYRPASNHMLRGGISADGRVVYWAHRYGWSSSASRSVKQQAQPLYDIADVDIDGGSAAAPVPTGFWRSVNMGQLVFVNESFMDELAHLAGADPYQFRRAHLSDTRVLSVLDRAASEAGWGNALPDGHGLGIGLHSDYNSVVAHVVEAEVTSRGAVRIHRVVTAVDCGIAVNPRAVEAQLEGTAADAIATVLKAGITIRDGGVVERTYAEFEWLRIDEMPTVEVHILESTQAPGGMGELGYPGMTAAIANAIFAAGGERYRALPISRGAPVDLPTPTASATPGEPTETPTPGPTADSLHRIYLPEGWTP